MRISRVFSLSDTAVILANHLNLTLKMMAHYGTLWHTMAHYGTLTWVLWCWYCVPILYIYIHTHK